jgi:hypothetical protein
MKKLKFYFMLLVMLMATSAKAENMQYLVFDLSDGTQTVIALADQPVITCQGGELKVMVAGEVKVQASLDDVAKYSFSPTAVTGIQEMAKEVSRMEMGHVYIAHAKKGETVRVFSIDGRQVAAARINDEGTADIDLTTLGKGLYIVKSAKTSIKVMNK